MDICPCGSGKKYCECCEPYHRGQAVAATAELLLRSRYSAFVKVEIAYIMNTIVPAQKKEIDEKGVRQWAEKTEWLKLDVLGTTKGGGDDSEGTVEFVAHFKDKGVTSKHHENAKFKKYEGKWYFEDSEFPAQKQFVRNEIKIGRNDDCTCGSGKKYKKCCGKNMTNS